MCFSLAICNIARVALYVFRGQTHVLLYLSPHVVSTVSWRGHTFTLPYTEFAQTLLPMTTVDWACFVGSEGGCGEVQKWSCSAHAVYSNTQHKCFRVCFCRRDSVLQHSFFFLPHSFSKIFVKKPDFQLKFTFSYIQWHAYFP